MKKVNKKNSSKNKSGKVQPKKSKASADTKTKNKKVTSVKKAKPVAVKKTAVKKIEKSNTAKKTIVKKVEKPSAVKKSPNNTKQIAKKTSVKLSPAPKKTEAVKPAKKNNAPTTPAASPTNSGNVLPLTQKPVLDRKGNVISTVEPIKIFKLKIDGRTIISVKSKEALKMWKDKYPNAVEVD